MSQKLLDAVFTTLTDDTEFMALLGLTPSSLMTEKIKRVYREEEPESGINSTTAPLVVIVLKPGRFGRNYLVYEGKFWLGFFAKTSFGAKAMSERAFKLFHDKPIVDTDFRASRCMLAHDCGFATGIKGIKGHEAIYDADYHRMN